MSLRSSGPVLCRVQMPNKPAAEEKELSRAPVKVGSGA